jgi:dTDP-D-glucose 4,6-dehydratase
VSPQPENWDDCFYWNVLKSVGLLNQAIDSGIKKTIEWYLENTVWCDRVKDGSYQGERLGTVNE